MNLKKSLTGILLLGLLGVSLILAACGDEVSVPTLGPAATSTTIAATSPVAPTITAQPSPVATSTTSPATTTTPAASPSPVANTEKKATPEAIVNRLYTDIKAGDKQKGLAVMFSANLRNSLKGKNALDSLNTMLGINNSQKIDSFKVSSPTISGDKATVTTTLTLTDGTSVVNNLNLVKANMKDKNGTDQSVWQIDTIKIG